MKNGEEDRTEGQAGAMRPRGGSDSALKARQKVIGAGLKRLYDSVVDEDVPADFSQLLAQLDNGGVKSSGGDS